MVYRTSLLGSCYALCALPQVLAASSTKPWQDVGPDNSAGHWFGEFEDTLATMQSTYWNGTYWPTTIQWIGAFFDTLLATSDASFVDVLMNDDGHIPGSQASKDDIEQDIEKYFSQIEAYYDGEDTTQIFGAAYDDAQWVVLEWLEAIKFINQYDAYAQSSLGQGNVAKFAHRAHIFYNIVQNQFNTSLCGGGVTWNPALAPYKNAITNELFLTSSVSMYLYFPGDNDTDPYPSPDYTSQTNETLPPLPTVQQHDPLFLENAKKEYEWFKSSNFTNAQGLIVDGFHISDNQTTCDQRNEMVYTYNQGVILSGLRSLWEATGETSYLSDGYELVDTVINAAGWDAEDAAEAAQWSGLGRNGVMEDYCDAAANCTQDSQAFKGIYFHHLDLFCGPLPTSTPLVRGVTEVATEELAALHAGKCEAYAPWIAHNAYAALSTRNSSDIIGGWWGEGYLNATQNVSADVVQPRPRGSWDEWNDPGVLEQGPWVCRGQHGCRKGVRGGKRGGMGRYGRRTRDVNDEGVGRTVETQASGLGVVKAASDFLMRGT